MSQSLIKLDLYKCIAKADRIRRSKGLVPVIDITGLYYELILLDGDRYYPDATRVNLYKLQKKGKHTIDPILINDLIKILMVDRSELFRYPKDKKRYCK